MTHITALILKHLMSSHLGHLKYLCKNMKITQVNAAAEIEVDNLVLIIAEAISHGVNFSKSSSDLLVRSE